MKKKIGLSLVIPCYNEEGNLPEIIKKILELKEKFTRIEVIIVDNGSEDSTRKILERELVGEKFSFVTVVSIPKNKGYGNGILNGLKVAQGAFLSWSHADLQTDLLDVVKGYQKIIHSQNPERTFVKGKRSGRSIFDTFFTFGMTLVSSLSLRTWVDDVNAQPKIFSRQLYEKMKDPPLDFSLDLYVLYLAKKNKIAIKTIPVLFKKRIHGEAKGGGSLRTKWNLVKRTFKYIWEFKR